MRARISPGAKTGSLPPGEPPKHARSSPPAAIVRLGGMGVLLPAHQLPFFSKRFSTQCRRKRLQVLGTMTDTLAEWPRTLTTGTSSEERELSAFKSHHPSLPRLSK